MCCNTLQNEFTGASPSYWECAGNWLAEGDLPAVRSPCGDDNAIFDQVREDPLEHIIMTVLINLFLGGV